MAANPILHILGWDKKFVPSFIKMVRENFPEEDHEFVIFGKGCNKFGSGISGVKCYPNLLGQGISVSRSMRKARKVIIHGLFSNHLYYVLALNYFYLKKCFWVIWGGDLYAYENEIKNWRGYKTIIFKRLIISRFGGLITNIEGDLKLAREWYGAKGDWHICFMYPSNLFPDHAQTTKRQYSSTTNILVGNSGDPTNKHSEIFQKLLPYQDSDIKIFSPLSYGNADYIDRTVAEGRALFKDKFIPLLEFMPFDEYLNLLAEIDVAAFNHNRQQAMGNTITLLGLGKRVFIRSDQAHAVFLKSIGITFFDIASLQLYGEQEFNPSENIGIIRRYFSYSVLVEQLKSLFEGD